MQYDFRKIEREVKAYWEKNKVPEKIVDFEENLKKKGKKFYLLDGPPYANAPPHAGHAMTIVFKDLWGKFKFMNGYAVWFQPGFDCHGLPIENMVEKRLGIQSKKEIEKKVGVENFIKMCREFAIQNLTEWMNYYKDLAAWKGWLRPYLTYEPYYIESIWWTVKKLFDEGLMIKGKKPIHWCPRCQTSISGYEATDSYKNVTDPSIYVKFRVKGKENEYLLAWTTTPWTLPANVALVVHPDENYIKVKVNDEILILAEKRLEDVMKRAGIEHYEVVEVLKGKDLDGTEYEPLMLELPVQQEAAKSGRAHRVVMSVPILKKVIASKVMVKKEIESDEGEEEIFGHMVTMDVGTGIVHCAPGHGPEDNKLGQHYGLPVLSPVDDDGKFTGEAGWLEGKFVKDADKEIIEHLRAKGLLFHAERIVHSYPLCWRCKTPLIYRTTDQWFFRIDPIKDLMLKFNEETRWLPDFARERMRHWVENDEDWCISTQRYWGAPIPIWECKNCGHMIAVGSKKELEEKMINEVKLDDLHKHVVDKVVLRCEKCGGEMKRIPDIINIWVESGVAPWASLGYPYNDGGLFNKLWRVDLVDESQDQIRGWFHAMLFMSAATFKERPYNVVCMNGWVLDEKGEKMSKSLGNVIPAEEAFEQLGADVLRLYVCYSTAPWETHKFSMKEAKELFRFMNILVNISNFIDMYGVKIKLDNHHHVTRAEDRWLLSRLDSTIKRVTEYIDTFHFHYAAREIVNFVMEDFSRFYLKIAKERYDEGVDRDAMDYVISRAYFEVLKMLALFTPYVAEYLYLRVFREVVGEESVHLLSWPSWNEKEIDETLESKMDLVMGVVEEVNSMRQSHNIRLRWPLEEVVLSANELTETLGDLKEIIMKLANVKRVEIRDDIQLEYEVKPRYDVIGPRFGKRTREVVEALKSLNGKDVLEALEKDGRIEIGGFELTEDMIDVGVKLTSLPEGYDGRVVKNTAVLLKVELTPELKEEGIARELIRRIQLARKELGLRFEDKAVLAVDGSKDFVERWKEMIEKETNTSVRFEAVEDGDEFETEGIRIKFRIIGA